MALQDLTPQLRTRLSKVERAVGWFVILAAVLLAAGFIYYVRHTAERKGWFKPKAKYFTLVKTGAGLRVGDPVKLMGKDVGEIIWVELQPPEDRYFNVFVQFEIHRPYYDYLWVDSRAKLVTADLLGGRYIEVTKGFDGPPTYKETEAAPAEVLDWKAKGKTNYVALATYPKGYYLEADEAPALNERLEKVAAQVEFALPNILDLTNRIVTLLDQSTAAAANANSILADAKPVVANLQQITTQLRDPRGSLGEWLIPTNLQDQLSTTLTSASATLTNTDAQITLLATELERTLQNLSDITSNLNAQVAANPEMLRSISETVKHTDGLVQGLKTHWLLRSAFKEKKTNPPVEPKSGKLQ